MFGRQEESSGVQGRAQSLIQEGVSVKGEIRAEGDVRVEGSLQGTILTKSRLIVGATGVVHADVEGAEVLVMGRINGKILGHRRIELRKGAHVEGDITTQALVIEEGVFFQGLAQMNVPGSGGGAQRESDREASQNVEGAKPLEKHLFSPTGSRSSN